MHHAITPMNNWYDLRLVAFSVLISICSSYAALDLAGRTAAARGQARLVWLIGGASAMGLGIWSMHYIGMLAFHLPISVQYDVPLVIISLLAAIGASAIALLTVTLKKLSWLRATLGATVMGAGIVAMHYLGMAAMRLDAECHYNWRTVIFSIAIAVFTSLAALWLVFKVGRRNTGPTFLKCASAIAMGLAITGMHYTGMAAADFTALNTHSVAAHATSISALGTVGIVLVALTVIFFSIVTSMVDRRFSAQTIQLESSERRYRMLFERTPVGIFRSTISGQLLDANDACSRILGYASSQEHLAHKATDHYFSLDDRQMFIDILRKEKSISNVELRIKRRDGAAVWVLLNAVLVENESAEQSIIEGTTVDITDRKLAEVELKEARVASDAASKAKSDFLATMSHEIRTPMNGILGMTDLVLDTSLNEEQRISLGMVKSSGESLLAIINDILDFSKIEAGKLELNLISFSLRESLLETIRSVSFRAHEKGLELVYYIDPTVKDSLYGDPGRLRQIIVNLVGNAIKFTEHGEVMVRVSETFEDQETVRLNFEVRDTGIGIPQHLQEKIFQSFSQADGSTTRRYGGTGLGLTISARLVEQMNGTIRVESEPGNGSTFYFTACFKVQAALETPVYNIDAEQLRNLRVLIVDDNHTNRAILTGMMRHWGAVSIAVESGTLAMEALADAAKANHPFQVVLLDSQMPGMDGFKTAEELKKIPESPYPTILMLTSADYPGDAARCRALGISAYLVKPISHSDLLQALCGVLCKPQHKVPDKLVTTSTLQEARRRLRVLLAEDNPVNQALAIRLLERRGFFVELADNGIKALSALEKQMFDVVLMDLQMPEMDGWQAITEIRRREKITGTHLPVIALTAHALVGDQQRCLEAGMDAHITKPIDKNELFAVIERVTNQASKTPPLPSAVETSAAV